MKRIYPVFVCCLLLMTSAAHADVWGNQKLGDSIAAMLATMLMLAYTVLFLMVIIVTAFNKKNARSKAMIVYYVLSLSFFLLFFIWLAAYFHSYPKPFGKILTEGSSEGTLHTGWMIIASFVAMLICITRLISCFRQFKDKNTW